jgi:hypothetical protein
MISVTAANSASVFIILHPHINESSGTARGVTYVDSPLTACLLQYIRHKIWSPRILLHSLSCSIFAKQYDCLLTLKDSARDAADESFSCKCGPTVYFSDDRGGFKDPEHAIQPWMEFAIV